MTSFAENVLDFVYHERFLRTLPGASELRHNHLLRARVLGAIIREVPERELDPIRRQEFYDHLQEILGNVVNKSVQIGSLIQSIPAACALWMGFRHWDLGAPVYLVGPRLRSMFERTALHDVVQGDVRLPFDTIYLVFPDCPWSLWGGKRRHPITGMFIQGIRHVVVQGTITEAFVSATGVQGLMLAIIGCDFGNGDDVIRTMPINLAMPMEQQCNDFHYDGIAGPFSETRQDDEASRVMVRVALNAVLYLAAELPAQETAESADRLAKRKMLEEQAGARRGGKAIKAGRRAERLSPVSVVWLGPSVESASQGGTHESPRQHWVSGHWHAYLHGPGRTLRKMNWVKPFLRGDPKRGQTEARIYMVEDEE